MKRVEISGIFLREKAPPDTQGWDHPQPQRMVLKEHRAFPEGDTRGKAPHYVRLCWWPEKLWVAAVTQEMLCSTQEATS